MESYTLVQGDCIELMRTLPDASISLVCCDLPYGITRNKWDAAIPFAPMWEQVLRVAKDNAAIVLFGAQPFTSALVMSMPELFRYELIWQKEKGTDFLNAKRKPLRAHENICVFYRKQPTYNQQRTQGHKPATACNRSGNKSTNYGASNKATSYSGGNTDRCPTTVLAVTSDKQRQNGGIHPTQKPVELMEWLVKTYSNQGETVLDFCMGSGSTGIACLNTGRRFVGFELDGGYFAAAKQRIEEHAGLFALCVND